MTISSRPLSMFLLGSILVLNSCFGSSESSAERDKNAETPAGKAGQAAHKIAKEGEKAAKEMNQKLEEAAHQAKDGWQKAAKDDKTKGK